MKDLMRWTNAFERTMDREKCACIPGAQTLV